MGTEFINIQWRKVC